LIPPWIVVESPGTWMVLAERSEKIDAMNNGISMSRKTLIALSLQTAYVVSKRKSPSSELIHMD
jgi:hypothetical protein